MNRRALSLALALALAPFGASATDLLQTYEMARNGDPVLANAESTRLANKEGFVQARALLLPQLNGSASLDRAHSNGDGTQALEDGSVINGRSTTDSRSRQYGVNVSQSIFDMARIQNVRAQRSLSQAADFNLDAANDSLITRTSAAYFNVLVAIETLAAAEAAETALQKQFDYADKRLEVGLAPITDVHEARAQYDAARANTILQRNTLADAYQAIAEITGQPVVNLRALPDDFRPTLPSDQDADAWVQTAIDSNPSLKALDLQVAASEANIAAARAGHLPVLSFSGSYGDSSTWGDRSAFGLEQGINSASESRSIGLTLTVPIFSGGATQSQVRESIYTRDATQDSLEQQKRAVVRNTRNAYQTLVAGISEIEARRLALFSAKSAYDASNVGLEVGTRTVLDVLINQQTLFSAQQQYALAKYNYLQNRLLLAQAAGTLAIADVQDVNRLLTADADSKPASGGPTRDPGTATVPATTAPATPPRR